MSALWNELITMPTMFFTIIAGLTTLYWLFVLVTGFDLFEGADGALDGAAESAGEGLFDAAADAFDGAADALDGAADGAHATHGGIGGLLHALHLRDVPVTMAASLVALTSWLICALSMRYLAPAVPDSVPAVLVGLVVSIVAVALAFPIAGAVARPFAPLFETQVATANQQLVGRSATVKSSRIPAGSSGQVEIETGGASMLIDVRSDASMTLQRGDKVLIVSYDGSASSYLVEPMSRLLEDDASLEAAVETASATRGGGAPM